MFSPSWDAVYTSTSSSLVVAQALLSELLVGVIPQNPISALATGNMLQIVAFTFLFGLEIIHVKVFSQLKDVAAFAFTTTSVGANCRGRSYF